MNNVLRALVYDGQVSLTLADTTELVREGIKLHKLSKGSALLFGKTLSAMTFMSAGLKGERGEISLALKSDGLCGDIGVSGNRALAIRGYIGETTVENTDERACLGENGSITIIRDDGYSRPFVGSCAVPENAGADGAFEEYFRISEQLPTRIATVVELDENGDCAFAGVVALQPLPFADDKALQKTQEAGLGGVLSELKNSGLVKTAEKHFGATEAREERRAEYKCNCSREYLLGVLVSLGESQMRQIIKEDGAVRVHCHYCNTDYEFTEEDADELFLHA